MEITHVSDVLRPLELLAPSLNALEPSQSNYTVLLMQPHGELEADSNGVRNQNTQLALKKFRGFLEHAINANVDLAVTPEYSMPWAALVGLIEDNQYPANGKLWVLGCESTTLDELLMLKEKLAPRVALIFEEIEPGEQKFLDPLVYVFVAPKRDDPRNQVVVMLVQFKTCPMADKDHFELIGMQNGSRVYQFGAPGSIRLLSLICSDALDFPDEKAREVYDRSLILHIQLNPKPRQGQFRKYRGRLMQFGGDETEIVCINWARHIAIRVGDALEKWKDVTGTAWYLRPKQFDDCDETLLANHNNGLYYTWLHDLRLNALFFNYEEAVFQVTASKVAHIGVLAVSSRRHGPLLGATLNWNEANASWTEAETVESEFSAIIAEAGDAMDQIADCAAANPLNTERLLALSAGKICHCEEWYNVRQLDSCSIDESEVIFRITFCQDPSQTAAEFRIGRLRRIRNLWDILNDIDIVPPALSDLASGFRLEWSANYPQQNALSNNGQRATLIYLGEEVNEAAAEETVMKVAEYLRRGATSADDDLLKRQRVAVWWRENGVPILFDPRRYTRIDETREASELDIGRNR